MTNTAHRYIFLTESEILIEFYFAFCIIFGNRYKFPNSDWPPLSAATRAEPMSRPTLHAIRETNADSASGASPRPSPSHDLNRRIVRLLRDEGRAAHDLLGRKLGVSGGTVRNRAARGDVMTRIGMFKYQLLLEHHVPRAGRALSGGPT